MSGASSGSHVLAAMGSDLAAAATLRLSLGWCSDESDVDRLLEVLPALVRGLRGRRQVAVPSA